jgi:hypothetical protein
MALLILFNPTTNGFREWGITTMNIDFENQSSGPGGCISSCNYTVQVPTRVFIDGNTATQDATVFFNGVADAGINGDNFNDIDYPKFLASFSDSATATTAVGGAGAHATFGDAFGMTADISAQSVISGIQYGAPVEIKGGGCINFLTPNTAPTAAVCSGTTLTAPPVVPAVDANGAFTLSWTFTTMPDKLEHLQ